MVVTCQSNLLLLLALQNDHDSHNTHQHDSLHQRILLALQNDHDSHNTQHDSLHPRMLTKHYRHVAHSWNVPSYAPYYILFSVQIALTWCVEFCVVCHIVVAFGKEFRT